MKGQKSPATKLGRTWARPAWMRNISVLVRALHQIGAAVFLAGCLFADGKIPPFYLYLVNITGILLVITEGIRHREMYRELFGIAILIKLILLGLCFHRILPLGPTALAAFFLSALTAHFPKKYRHMLLF